MSQRVAVLGAGKMGEALLSGLLRGRHAAPATSSSPRAGRSAPSARGRATASACCRNADAAAQAPTRSSSP